MQKDVANERISTIAVIKIDSAGMALGFADVAEEVVSDEISATRRIAAFVESAGVLGVRDDIANDVVFYDIVVANNDEGLMRRIVNQVVCNSIADTGKGDSISAGELEP